MKTSFRLKREEKNRIKTQLNFKNSDICISEFFVLLYNLIYTSYILNAVDTDKR